MTYEELMQELASRQALIVHFSHYAEMDRGTVFPDDLRNAAANIQSWLLSCLVVWPGRCRAVGSVGIVLRPTSLVCITSVSPSDSGSSSHPDGSHTTAGRPLSRLTFDETFAATGEDYNEWTVTKADVVGISVCLGSAPEVKKRNRVAGSPDPLFETIAPVQVSLSEIFQAFPDLPVFSFHDGRIIGLNVPASFLYH